ncbi:DUF1631 domain-containing protein [Microbulbifer bruguierae]|uniref:DUF1631 domain-containing protein n=1 Tax=Microbulbifer bruguierae TaxID=3029061 RepID=A0ABY8NCJ3_9GAMM|nr:DUF1631 domain-containing protein [Microbulbifer bruguierae]WGL16643.1 DUF1631 domain-containing protein [Microbulbifer bruguierae]
MSKDDMDNNIKELFVITNGGKSGTGRTAGKPAAATSRQLSKTVNLVSQKAVEWLQARAGEVFAQVDDSLFGMAEKAHQQEEQDRLFHAIRALRVELSNLVDGFCDGVQERFHSPKNDIPGEEAALESSKLKNLSLVNDDDLEQQVAIRTMVANIKRDHAEAIASLSLRLDTLLPSKIYDENLPLGPGAVCAAFTDVLGDVEMAPRARMTVLKKFELHLINRLGELLDSSNRLLVEQGVLPTIEDPLRRQGRKPARGQATASGATPEAPAGESSTFSAQAEAGQVPYGQAGQLQMQAAYSGAASGGPGSAQAGNYAPGLMPLGSGAAPMATPALLQHLGQLQMGLPMQSGATGQLVNVTQMLEERLVAAKQSASLHELDSEVIRLVDMLFSFMLEDRNLAEPIKVQLIRLQLPMLKLAVADKGFFSKGGHPARRLLNELADAAIGWQPSENYLNDPLYREVCTIVEGVLAEYDQDDDVFERLLESFREFTARERKRAAVMERRTIDEAQGTARVEAAKARVAAVFDALTAERNLPKIVHEWLNRVWSSVLFRACLKEGTESGVWRQHVLTARDLIWSVVAPMPESSGKIQRLLPDLKKRLTDGAQSLSLSAGDQQRLKGGLEVLYRERQKLGERVESERERRTRERLVQELRREADSIIAIPDTEETVLVPPQTEAAQSVLDDARELPAGQPALPEVEEIQLAVTEARVSPPVALKPLPQDDSHWQETYHLKDSWFLLRNPEKLPVRCRLAAIIKDLDQFMFVNRAGAKVGVYSRLELAHALRNEELLPLEKGPLFERALEYVVGNCGESKIAISF